jgi:hypothetical protein
LQATRWSLQLWVMQSSGTETIVSKSDVLVRLFSFYEDGSFRVASPLELDNQRGVVAHYGFCLVPAGWARTVHRKPAIGAFYVLEDGGLFECGFEWRDLENFARRYNVLKLHERLEDSCRGGGPLPSPGKRPSAESTEVLAMRIRQMMGKSSGAIDVRHIASVALENDPDISAFECVRYIRMLADGCSPFISRAA